MSKIRLRAKIEITEALAAYVAAQTAADAAFLAAAIANNNVRTAHSKVDAARKDVLAFHDSGDDKVYLVEDRGIRVIKPRNGYPTVTFTDIEEA